MAQSTTSVKRNNVGLSDKEASSLAKELEALHRLKHFEACQNKFTSEGISIILKVLSDKPVKILSLMDNRLDAEAGKAIAQFLESNPHCQKLALRQNRLGDVGTSEIAKALVHHSSLKLLSVANNTIGDKGAKELADVLQANCHLTFLDLSDNQIKKEGFAALCNAVSKNQTLNKLYVAGNAVSPESIVTGLKTLKNNTTLAELYLTPNHLDLSELENIVSALSDNEGLLRFGLGCRDCLANEFQSTWEKVTAVLKRNQFLEEIRNAITCFSSQTVTIEWLIQQDTLMEQRAQAIRKLGFEARAQEALDEWNLALCSGPAGPRVSQDKAIKLLDEIIHHHNRLRAKAAFRLGHMFFFEVPTESLSTIENNARLGKAYCCFQLAVRKFPEAKIFAAYTLKELRGERGLFFTDRSNNEQHMVQEFEGKRSISNKILP